MSGRAPSSVPDAIEEIRRGRAVVVCDGDGDGEGDLVLAARFATPASVNFLMRRAGGLVSLALPPERCAALELEPPGRGRGPAAARPALTIDASELADGGDSAHDRARTIQVAVHPAAQPSDLRRPGHVLALMTDPHGVVARPERAEAAVDLVRLAGLGSSAVLCAVLTADGSRAHMPELVRLRRRHGLALVTVPDVVAHRWRTERLVERVVTTDLPTKRGRFMAVGFRSLLDDGQHVALVRGDVDGADDVPVHVHLECVAGDVFRSRHCDCGERLEAALEAVARADRGIVLYLALGDRRDAPRHAPRAGTVANGNGLRRRERGICAQVLRDLGPASVRMLDADAETVAALRRAGLHAGVESGCIR